MRFDRPLQVGADGGHGDVRYVVEDYEPGRRIVFRFDPSTGLDGVHRLEASPDGIGTELRHVLKAEARGPMRVLWPLVVRWMHDACLEDLLDRAERSLGAGPALPAKWSPWMRTLWSVASWHARRPREVTPGADVVQRSGLAAPDFADAFAVPLPRGAPRDPGAWCATLVAGNFLDAFPGWVRGLLGVRTALARAMGLDSARPTGSPFALLTRTDDLVVTGLDDKHLDFRALFHVDDLPDGTPALVMTTVVQRHNLAGRAYFALIRPFHRWVVRALLARLARSGAARVAPVG